MDANETPQAALVRELQEELNVKLPNIEHLTDFSFTLGRHGTITRHFFQIRLPSSAFDKLQLREGADMRAFSAPEILILPRVVPYDSFAIWLHASGMLLQ